MHRDGRRATGKTSQAVAATAELVLDGQPVVIVCPSRAEQIATRRLLSDRIEATRPNLTLCVNQPAFTDALSFVWCIGRLTTFRGVSGRTTVFWDLSAADFPDWARDELHMAGYQRVDQTAYQHNVNSVPLTVTAETLRAAARSTLEQSPYRSGTLR